MLLEKKPIDLIEAKIMINRFKKEFAFYYIKQLLDSDFSRKSLMSTIGS